MESLNPNKHLKQQFVSNLTGSSKLEIALLITIFSSLIIIRHCVGFNWLTPGSLKKDNKAAANSKSFKSYVAVLIVDYLCIVVPYILVTTVLADWAYENTVVVVLAVLFMIAVSRKVV